MASALTKRQQARNERTLQELIKTVPGNGVCADCGARNPGWASWSLGIFLCMRCAALHRKLGTHISKVKSLSMDKWDNAQVDNMKRMGNVESNKAYNPRNAKPQMPIDIDEVDSAMERYIRQKYQERAFLDASRPGTRQNTGSTSSAEDRPPPLPPKPTKRFTFGLQKASTFSSSHSRNTTPPVSPGLGGFGQETSPPRVNKQSRVFGTNINTSGDGLDSKLATLRDMGFPDEKRNSTVLKGLNGNLDRAVEALIRLGEQNATKSRGTTPTPNGVSIQKSQTAPATTISDNPFEALDTVAPLPQQQPQPTPIYTQQNPYGTPSAHTTSPTNPYNPFLAQQSSFQQPNISQQFQQQHSQAFTQQHNPFNPAQQGLEQSFQNMQLNNQQSQQSSQQQQLFPNRTGGYSTPQPQFAQSNPFQQSFTPPPMPQMPQQYASMYQPQQNQYQPVTSPNGTGASNPFLKSARSQMFTPPSNSNPFGAPPQQMQQTQQASNPFMTQNQTASAWQSQQPQFQQNRQQNTQQAQFQQNGQQNYQQPQLQGNGQQSYQQPQFQQNGQHNYQQQSSNPFDRSSILALYNYPQLAPQRSEPAQPAPAAAPAQSQPATIPNAGNHNPFAAQQQGQQTQGLQPMQQPRHVSNESVDFAGLMGGRHSPDAFSGLSASFRR